MITKFLSCISSVSALFKHSLRHTAVLLLLSLFLTACQTRLSKTNSADGGSWHKNASYFRDLAWQPANLVHWEYAAKVGLVVEGKSEQANLTWRYHDQSNQVRLFGPLGSGAVKLEFDNYSVVLTDNKGRKYEGNSAQELMSDIVGWPLPIDALQSWLFARPKPGAAFEYQLNEFGQIKILRQLGWRIDYKDWRDYQGQQLPRKVFATGPESEQAITVRLVTKSWQLQ